MKEIPLTRGYVAFVDDADYELVSGFKWCLNQTPRRPELRYAHRSLTPTNGKRRSISMHRLLMNPPLGMQVDHIDGNGLNNQRHNLRICSQADNAKNRRRHIGGYKGVKPIRNTSFQARIRVQRVFIDLGCYPTPEAAAIAYNDAAITYFGSFAGLNVVDPSERKPRNKRVGYASRRNLALSRG